MVSRIHVDGFRAVAGRHRKIFSLSEKNRKYAGADGIPYRGSCTSDHPFSSSNSHPQVRSMSFIYDNIDPAKSAAKSRKATATKAAEKALKKKTAKKKAAEKKAAAQKAAKKAEEKAEEKRLEKKQHQEEMLEDLAEGKRERFDAMV